MAWVGNAWKWHGIAMHGNGMAWKYMEIEWKWKWNSMEWTGKA
jgi:hypothetical protein